MAFRIIKTDFDSDDLGQSQTEYEACDKRYRKHLENQPDKESDLWKYFYWDTFHDGHISKIVFWKTPGDITFHINCPNIKKKNGDSYVYLLDNIEFECHFRDVLYFSFEHENPEELVFDQTCPFEYRYSEIDTLTELIEKKKLKDEDEDGEGDFNFHSLIIEVYGAKSSFFIEMVFSQVDVWPKEPLAFELMQNSDEFFVPVYRKDLDVENLPKWVTNHSG